MSKKPATIFDFIAGITHKKKDWNKYSDIDQKKFSPFIVNRWLSMRQELVEIINAFQHFTIGTLSPKDTYRLYHDMLPQSKSFAKYIKGKAADKYNKELVKQLAEHYQISQSEATEYIGLMNKEKCEYILTLYGYSLTDKKRLLKGIK